MRVGILGGGQLGRMLALAGYPLGLTFRIFEPAADAPAGVLAPQVQGAYADEAALAAFADSVDVLTYEWENVPLAAAEFLAKRVPVYPPPVALATAQDRLVEKQFFASLGADLPGFMAVATRADLQDALVTLGTPAVLKTRRDGYDGKGQFVIRTPADADAAWEALGGRPLILEALVPFTRELSVIAVRAQDGATVVYPLMENTHHGGILRQTIAPAVVDPSLQAEAAALARAALDALDYVGVLAIELFEVRTEDGGRRTEGSQLPTSDFRPPTSDLQLPASDFRLPTPDFRLLVNEMAPRVHNSGHWTIEGAVTSQFANHVRAVAGLPLGLPDARGYAAMFNVIGAAPDTAAILAIPGAQLHLYGKAPRAGRKLGHVTVCAPTLAECDAALVTLHALLQEPGT